MKRQVTVDLSSLPPATRRRVEKALRSRNQMVSRRFPQASVDAWQAAAASVGQSLTSWMQHHLDAAAKAGAK